MCVWRVIRFIIYVLVIMLSLVTAREFIEKRGPEDRQSWFMGSRYGRSSSGATVGQVSNSRRLIVTPRRDDRFHPGSRYGKRTPPAMLTAASRTPEQSDTLTPASLRDVECSYTGVADLYRCHIRNENASGEFMAN